jgi:hypothetical protein
MSRRTTARVVWLILGALLVTTGVRVAIAERPFVSILIGSLFFAVPATLLATWEVRLRTLLPADERTEVRAMIREDLNR